MYAKIKFAMLILIIYSRLDDLKAVSLNDSDKNTNTKNHSYNNNKNENNKNSQLSSIDKLNAVYNNYNPIFDSKNFSSANIITNNQQKNYKHTFIAATKTNNASLSKQQKSKQRCQNDGKDSTNSSCDNSKEIFNSDESQSNNFEKDTANNGDKFVYFEPSINRKNAKSIPTDQFQIKNLKTRKAESTDNSYPNKFKGYESKNNKNQLDITEESPELEKDQSENIWDDILNDLDIEDFMRKYASEKNKKCLLNELRNTIQWWTHINGTLKTEAFTDKRIKSFSNIDGYLDFSFQNITDDETLHSKTMSMQARSSINVTVFSVANNNLTHIPYRTLSTMKNTITYLTLKGNSFLPVNKTNWIHNDIRREHREHYRWSHPCGIGFGILNNITNSIERSKNYMRKTYKKLKNRIEEGITKVAEIGIAWATFPKMPHLLELDISDCNVEILERDAFVNITSLRKLYISHNKIFNLPHDVFELIPELEYLDLSFNNMIKFDLKPRLQRTLDAAWHLVGGVRIHSTTFKNLTKLIYLDLSHTKIMRNSEFSFLNLGPSLKFMSLCFTFLPILSNALFKNTALVGLDLSGNPYLAHNNIEYPFEGITDSLKYLFFEESNHRDLEWLKYLENLHLLSLKGNYIYGLTPNIFENLKNLQALDLSYNIISNWYTQIWKNNTNLRLLNLNHNNLNIINAEMIKDFKNLHYLGLSNNNFLCDCLLNDLMEIAKINKKKIKCLNNLLTKPPEINGLLELPIIDIAPTGSLRSFDLSKMDQHLTSLMLQRHSTQLEQSFKNLQNKNVNTSLPRLRYVARNGLTMLRSTLENTYECEKTLPNVGSGTIFNGTSLKFQFLDYSNDLYWCFNGTNRFRFKQLNCEQRAFDVIASNNINKLTQIVAISVCSLVSITLLIVIVYLKRWHIYYYYSSLKSAALLSVATKEQVNKFNELAENDPNMVYDIFISYCQNDRKWVLEELLPNVEETGNISICLHERDFQIGVAILENIISCMDRSRALMLIISSNFLLSHWCQFEMHLAQHRIFEVSKEHLIIVFLEDIPLSKRPKSLQYLMEVKTYIKWPGSKGREVKLEERKNFWKRMRSSLERIGISPLEMRA